ncbi:DUF937 domain-containing protein [Pseudoxanthomonas helianthi]|uniref:DUF937 domain-containing protein n=1 Tax=Pseudoxanthomonas helianthi TaxID=1453541 RepID=A0A940X6U4_9GAMM|nr:DUF937 domain-containing protein [Pseudoxanthomonas helianthi]MBP3985897.1 DUF937 domain-containing protein [Pseudoxanthomonas helianthi]
MSNDSLADLLFQQLQGAPLQQISQQLGTGQMQTSNAVGAALPLLLGALGKNAAQPGGAEALFGALQNDHAGGLDLGGILGSVLGGGAPTRQTDGGAILGHIFGASQPRAEASLGQATGLGGDKTAMLLKILAPIVLSFLAQRFLGGQGGAATDASGLGQILGQERQVQQQQGGLGGGLLGAVLDQDGDGQLGLGDILKIGGGLLGGGR